MRRLGNTLTGMQRRREGRKEEMQLELRREVVVAKNRTFGETSRMLFGSELLAWCQQAVPEERRGGEEERIAVFLIQNGLSIIPITPLTHHRLHLRLHHLAVFFLLFLLCLSSLATVRLGGDRSS
jgi:hypothetical protein